MGQSGLKVEAANLTAGNGSESVSYIDASASFVAGQNAQYKGFAYTDEIVESCAGMELSLYIAIGTIVAFALLVVVVVIAVLTTLNYRKKMYQILDERGAQKELKEIESTVSCNEPA